MIFILETLRLGISNLRLHKLRSLLTALGIIFGVAAVILMVAIGEGNKQVALAKIRQLGARNIIARSVKPPEPQDAGDQQRSMMVDYGLRRVDLRRIEQLVKQVERVVPLKQVASQIRRGRVQTAVAVMGTTPDLALITSLTVQRGRYLSDSDLEQRANVAVVGAEVAQRLFALEDPVDSQINVGDKVFQVVGVLAPVGLAGGAGSALVGRDLNFDVHIPLTTASSSFGDTMVSTGAGSFSASHVELTELYIQAADENSVVAVAQQVRLVLEHEHVGKNDVSTIVPLELLEQEKSTRLILDALLIAIAFISLLVGGIGIMNIMLATVTERTREIGIRRAVGATRRHIIAQFLTETTLLSALGGLVGVALGLSSAAALGLVHQLIPGLAAPQVPAWSVFFSFLVATAVGIIFGLYPAVRAAQQDPIVALRHD